MSTTPYDQGREAHRTGKRFDDNPHECDAESWAAWRRGYNASVWQSGVRQVGAANEAAQERNTAELRKGER